MYPTNPMLVVGGWREGSREGLNIGSPKGSRHAVFQKPTGGLQGIRIDQRGQVNS